MKRPHITSKVLLLAQDDLVRIEQLRDSSLLSSWDISSSTRSSFRQPAVLLEHPFSNNASRDWIELRVARIRRSLSLLELLQYV